MRNTFLHHGIYFISRHTFYIASFILSCEIYLNKGTHCFQFILTAILGVCYAAKLDNTYLPPEGAGQAGGGPGLAAPFGPRPGEGPGAPGGQAFPGGQGAPSGNGYGKFTS